MLIYTSKVYIISGVLYAGIGLHMNEMFDLKHLRIFFYL